MARQVHEHKFLADFQPWELRPGKNWQVQICMAFNASLNWAALAGGAYVVGYCLRLGWGG